MKESSGAETNTSKSGEMLKGKDRCRPSQVFSPGRRDNKVPENILMPSVLPLSFSFYIACGCGAVCEYELSVSVCESCL